jgi:hypothetical protein
MLLMSYTFSPSNKLWRPSVTLGIKTRHFRLLDFATYEDYHGYLWCRQQNAGIGVSTTRPERDFYTAGS